MYLSLPTRLPSLSDYIPSFKFHLTFTSSYALFPDMVTLGVMALKLAFGEDTNIQSVIMIDSSCFGNRVDVFQRRLSMNSTTRSERNIEFLSFKGSSLGSMYFFF